MAPQELSTIMTLADLREGLHADIGFIVTEADMQRFAALSGDYNPLHQDSVFAQGKGFQDKVVYGALLIAKLSQVIGMRLPGRDSVWSSLSLRFHNPLYVGEAAQAEATVIFVSPATKLVALDILVRAGERILAKGKAEVLLAAS